RAARHRMGQHISAQTVGGPLPSEPGTHHPRRPTTPGELMAREFRLPGIGEGLTEAEIVRWVIPVGGTVAADETVVEVETDKAVVEVPSPFAGVVHHHGAAEGEIVEVGEILVVVGEEGETWPAAEEGSTATEAAVETDEEDEPVPAEGEAESDEPEE